MATGDEQRRIERVVEDARERAGRAGAEAGERALRAWGAVRERLRHAEADGPGDGEPKDEDQLFSEHRRREIERLGHANILVVGQTGVGKSTLINAVFRKPLAATSTGRPVTKVVERYDDPEVPVTLYDTKGVELGDAKGRVIRDFKRIIARSRKGPPEEHIHLLWYCMDAGQTRVQDYDIEIFTALAEEVPAILVLTQVIDDERADELESTALDAGLALAGDRAVRTLALERRIAGRTLPSRGLDQLVRLTADLLPEAVRRAFVNAQGVVIDLKADQSRALVAAAAAAAAGIAVAPVPLSDAMLLRPVQLGMLAGVTAVFGLDLSNDQVLGLARGAIGQGAMEQAGKRLVKEVAKHLPGANVVNATVAAALTGALGEAYIRLCSEILRRQAAGRPMPDAEMVRYFMEVYGRLVRRSQG